MQDLKGGTEKKTVIEKNELNKLFSGKKRIMFMGIGSVLRSDDAAGIHFAKRLTRLVIRDDVAVVEGGTAPENFTGVIKAFRPDLLVLVDAAHMGINVGHTAVLDKSNIGGISFSTHMLPVSLTLDYIENELGCDTAVIGIQPQNTEQGIGMCTEVQSSAEKLAQDTADILNSRN